MDPSGDWKIKVKRENDEVEEFNLHYQEEQYYFHYPTFSKFYQLVNNNPKEEILKMAIYYNGKAAHTFAIRSRKAL